VGELVGLDWSSSAAAGLAEISSSSRSDMGWNLLLVVERGRNFTAVYLSGGSSGRIDTNVMDITFTVCRRGVRAHRSDPASLILDRGPDERPDQKLYIVEHLTRHGTSSARNGRMAQVRFSKPSLIS
jgi:hypothetical protein